MYRITPLYGDSFTCNGPHILTLCGITPFITTRNDKPNPFIVTYSKKGKVYSKSFFHHKDASSFKSLLKEDIIDISVLDYLRLPPKQKKILKLFHTGVSFQETETPIFPSFLYGVLQALRVKYHKKEDNFSVARVGLSSFLKLVLMLKEKYNVSFFTENNLQKISFQDKALHNNLVDILKYSPNTIHLTYKLGARKTRKEFLHGYFIAEKYLQVTTNGIHIETNHPQDLTFIAFSLGYMVVKKGDGILIQGRGWMKMNTFIKEKIKEFSPNAYFTEGSTKQSFVVQKLGIDDYYGFELDKDGRFLLGDFLVTHNTSCLSEIIHLLKGTYVVCSFTGKAVARTREFVPKENTGTIHRILMLETTFDVIIVDESSMLPLELFKRLIEKFPDACYLFIGDVNQLQPIQWGSLFYSLIESKTIPIARLVKNHRVSRIPGEKNGIIMNANLMLDPNARPFSFIKTENFKFIEGHKSKAIEIIQAFKETGTTAEEMSILTPYNETSDTINPECQKLFNSTEAFVTDSKGKNWHLNDRVMMTKNSLQGVYNGEIGTIVKLYSDHIDVQFGEDRIVPYVLYQSEENENEEGNEGEEESYFVTAKVLHTSLLKLAFCLTVDKSQGSEWEMVVFYIPKYTGSNFLNNNRIYTAITRAKQMVYIVSPSNKSLYGSVEKKCPVRYDNIVKRLKSLLPEVKENKEFQEEDMESIMNSMLDDDFD